MSIHQTTTANPPSFVDPVLGCAVSDTSDHAPHSMKERVADRAQHLAEDARERALQLRQMGAARIREKPTAALAIAAAAGCLVGILVNRLR